MMIIKITTMNDNIDLTKILKDCPKGWKFYTPVWGEVSFDRIYDNGIYVISIATERDYKVLTKEGCYLNREDAECIFFPSKDQRDWSKFTAPWLKKERDVFIAWLEEQERGKRGKKEYGLKSSKDEDVRKFMQYIEKQAKAYDLNLPNRSYDIYAFAKDLLVWLDKQGEQEEPQVYETEDGEIITYSETDGYKFADKIEPRFKDGDVLVNGSNILIFHFINNRRLMGYCHVNMDDGNFYNDIGRIECFCTIDAPVTPATKEQRDLLFQKIKEAGYKWNAKTKTLEKLSESKFDPKTLNPFDKVLVKMSNESFNTWYGDFVAEPSHAKNETPLILGAKEANMVIPYNDDTKHLVGTTDEAPEYYRYWED